MVSQSRPDGFAFFLLLWTLMCPLAPGISSWEPGLAKSFNSGANQREKSPRHQMSRAKPLWNGHEKCVYLFPFWEKISIINGQFDTYVDGWTFLTNLSVFIDKIPDLERTGRSFGLDPLRNSSYRLLCYLFLPFHNMEQLSLMEKFPSFSQNGSFFLPVLRNWILFSVLAEALMRVKEEIKEESHVQF